MLPVLLVLALLTNSVSAQPASGRKLTVLEQVTEIPVGSTVEVQTLDKRRIRGQIGEATAEGFALQRIRNQKFETISIAFADAKSVKVVSSLTRDSAKASVGKTTGKVAIGVLAGAGVVALILIIIVAAAGQ